MSRLPIFGEGPNTCAKLGWHILGLLGKCVGLRSILLHIHIHIYIYTYIYNYIYILYVAVNLKKGPCGGQCPLTTLEVVPY